MEDQSKRNHELLKENFFLKQVIQNLQESRPEGEEAELREREENAKIIIREMHESFWMTSSHNPAKLIDVNEATCRMLGYRRNELLKMSLSDIAVNESAELIKRRTQHAIKTGFVYFESQFKRKSGFVIDVQVSITYLAKRKALLWFHRDITEKKQVEDKLRLREEYYRTILQTAMDGILWMDLQGHIIKVNEAYCRMSGYSDEELLIKSIHDIDVTARAFDMPAGIRKLMEKGKNRFETKHRRKDGSIIDVEISAQYLPTTSGTIVSFLRDITEERRREKELRVSNEILRTLLDKAPEPVFVKDQESRMILVNPATVASIGKPQEEIIGKNSLEIYGNTDTARAIMEHDRLVMDSNRTFTVEEHIPGPGGPRVFQSTKAPYHDDKGNVIGVIGVSFEITAHKLLEEQIRQKTQTRYRSLFHTAMDGIIWLDVRGCLREVNDTYCQMSGYSLPELLKMKITDLDVDQTPEEVVSHKQRVIEKGQERFASRHRRKDGSIMDVEISVQHRTDDRDHFAVFVRDITRPG